MAMACLLRIAPGGRPRGKSLHAWFNVGDRMASRCTSVVRTSSLKPEEIQPGAARAAHWEELLMKSIAEPEQRGNGIDRNGFGVNRIAEFGGWVGAAGRG